MQDTALKILDNGLVTALVIFVLTFCAYLAGSAFATHWWNRKLMQGLQSRFVVQHPNEIPDFETRNAWRSYLRRWDGIRAGVRATLWSGCVSCLAFLFLCFSPWPTMANFANLSSQPPLRVTFLMVDPTVEGFRFEGDVWNQSEARIPVRASIVLLDAAGGQVGGATVPLEPQELGPRDKGQFVISVGPSAQATGFALRFLGASDQELAYAKGFPER